MKSVLISIQPKWVEKIASGEKTIEVRKTRPKIETPFKCYIYCTNGTQLVDVRKEKIYLDINKPFLFTNGKSNNVICSTPPQVNRKVIGEFVCNRVDERWFYISTDGVPITDIEKDFEALCCLKRKEIINYALQPNKALKVHNGTMFIYGWHITDLKIYDEPKELSKFIKPFKYDGDGLRCCTKEELEDIYEWDCETLFNNKYPNFDFENCKCEDCPKAKDFYRLKLAPQSWCYVESGV